jgi:hypothetical protein
MKAHALALALAVLGGALPQAGDAEARPRRVVIKKKQAAVVAARAVAAPPPAIVGDNVSVRIIHRGEMSHVELRGTRLRVERTVGEEALARTAAPEERRRIVGAALAALDTSDWRRSCGRGDTYISITVDGRTGGTALCAEARPDEGPWRALLDVLRPMVVATAAE